jgi:hypothetical protein
VLPCVVAGDSSEFSRRSELVAQSEGAGALQDQRGTADAGDQRQQATVLDGDAGAEAAEGAAALFQLRQGEGGGDHDQADDGESDAHLCSDGVDVAGEADGDREGVATGVPSPSLLACISACESTSLS